MKSNVIHFLETLFLNLHVYQFVKYGSPYLHTKINRRVEIQADYQMYI